MGIEDKAAEGSTSEFAARRIPPFANNSADIPVTRSTDEEFISGPYTVEAAASATLRCAANRVPFVERVLSKADFMLDKRTADVVISQA